DEAQDTPASSGNKTLQLSRRKHQVIEPGRCVLLPADAVSLSTRPERRLVFQAVGVEDRVLDSFGIDTIGDDPSVVARDCCEATEQAWRAALFADQAEVVS